MFSTDNLFRYSIIIATGIWSYPYATAACTRMHTCTRTHTMCLELEMDRFGPACMPVRHYRASSIVATTAQHGVLHESMHKDDHRNQSEERGSLSLTRRFY